MVEDLGEGKQIKSAENEAMPFPFNYKGDYFYFMFTADACNAEVQKMFSKYPDIEVLVAMGSGMDYILPALRQYNHTDVKMLCLGYNDDTMQYMQDGTLLAAGTNNYVQCMASMFARAYDALESDGAAWYSDRPAATAENYQYNGADGAADYTIMTSVAEVEDFENYIVCDDKGNGPITNEELKQCMLSFNEDATWAPADPNSPRERSARSKRRERPPDRKIKNASLSALFERGRGEKGIRNENQRAKSEAHGPWAI